LKKLYLILSLTLFSACCFAQSRYISQTTKKIVFVRDGGICQCCGNYENIEYDHISPYSCGGSNDASNIQLLCRTCNRSKSNSCFCNVHDKKVGIDCCKRKTNTAKSKQSSIKARQCLGVTKKGRRCKNKTKNLGGRCHYHQ
jgi:hypothetical protein